MDSTEAARVVEVKWCLVPKPGWTERSGLPMVVHGEYWQHNNMADKWCDACYKLEDVIPVPLLLAPLDERHDVPKAVTATRCAGKFWLYGGGGHEGGRGPPAAWQCGAYGSW